MYITECLASFGIIIFNNISQTIAVIDHCTMHRHHHLAFTLYMLTQINKITSIIRKCDIDVIVAIIMDRHLFNYCQISQFLLHCHDNRTTLLQRCFTHIGRVWCIAGLFIQIDISKTDMKRLGSHLRNHL